MLKVFLVEDEYVVRGGIKNNIDWNSHGYEFCGEASDGELAFPMIQKLKPDIVITDIKMPFMDGLELSRLIKKEMPWIEIIVLTGYEEFEYAKEGIKIGIAEYLTKPINGEELLKEVDAVAVRIEEKKKEREIREKYRKEMEENFLQEKKDLFQYLVTGTKPVAELIEMGNRLEMDLTSLWYDIVLIDIQSMDHAREEYSNSLIEIEQKLRRLQEDAGVLIFDRNLEGEALLFRAGSEEELSEIRQRYLDDMQEILKQYEHVRYFVGIGIPVNRLTDLPDSFRTASHAYAHRFLVDESRILMGKELQQAKYLNTNDFDIGDINPKKMDRGKVKEFLKLGDRQETIYFVEEYFKELGTDALHSEMFRQYVVMDIYFCAMDFLDDLQLPKEELPTFDVSTGAPQSEESTMQYVISVINKALELREKKASNRYGDVVEEVMRYIELHYAEDDLSLKLLASHVNFSPNHLSMIFAQQTGQTLIKYLTEFRMNKAKELLRCTGKGSSEIGMEVGYKDAHYFSYLFKKTQGMTPTQYRGTKTADGDVHA